MAVVLQVIGEYNGKQIAAAQRDLNKLKSQVEGSTSAYAKAGGGLDGVTAAAAQAGASMEKAGKKLSIGVTLPLVAVGVAGVNTAADFDVSMASLKVNAGIGGQALEDMRTYAMKMGADTVFSAGESATAMLELSKAGVDAATIAGDMSGKTGALAATMNLAATEGMGLADAATIVSNAMNAYGIEAEHAADVSGILAAGAVASTASAQGLAAGLKYVGSTAASLDVGLADSVTALAALNNAGIDASTAGTSFNRFLLGLVPKSERAAKTMKALGTEFQNTDGSLKTMPEIIATLRDGLDGLSKPVKMKALKDMFGVEGARAAVVLMDKGVKGWKELSKEVNKTGVDAELADARMSGMAGALEQARGSAETAALVVGEALGPAVETVAGWVTTLTNKFTALSPGMQTAIVSTGAFLAALGPVLFVGGKVAKSLGTVVSAARTAGTALSAAKTGLTVLKEGYQSAAVAQSAFSGRMGTLGGAARSVVNGVTSGAQAVKGMTVQVVRSGAAWVASTASMVAAKTAQVAMAVATKAAAAAQWVLNAAMAAAPWMLLIAAVVALVVIIVKNWDTIKAYLLAAWTWIKNTAGVVWGAIAGVLSAIWDGIKVAVMFVFDAIKAYFTLVFTVYRTIIETAVKVISAVLGAAWDGIKVAVMFVFDAIKAYFTTVVQVYATILGAAWTAIKRGAEVAWALVKVAIINPMKAAWATLQNVVEAVRSGLSGAWDRIKATTSAAWSLVKDKITGPIGDAYRWVVDKMGALVSWFGGLGGKISAKVAGAFDGLKTAFKSAVNAMIGWWNRLQFTIAGGGFTVLGKHIDIPSFTLSTPDIPYLAAGGIVTGPTLAVLGEAGPEKVIPLSSPGADRYGSRQVIVERGAVQVQVQAPAGADTDQIQEAVEKAVEEAFGRLLREVAAA